MQFILAPLLPLTLSLGCIRSSAVPNRAQLGFFDLPVEMIEAALEHNGLVGYVALLSAGITHAPVTPDFEQKLLRAAAEEEKFLDSWDDFQRMRRLRLLSAARTLIRMRSGLPITIDPKANDGALKQLATQLETRYNECVVLSDSRFWGLSCMAALLGKDTLARLLPLFPKEFLEKTIGVMIKAAVIVGDFDTFKAIANYNHVTRVRESLTMRSDDIVFSGNVEFAEKLLDFVVTSVPAWHLMLHTAIAWNRHAVFKLFYSASRKHLSPDLLQTTIVEAFKMATDYGRLDIFKQLHSDYPEWLDIRYCVIRAAATDHINLLEFLLYSPNPSLAAKAKTFLPDAFEGAVKYGGTGTLEFLLGRDKHGNLIAPALCPTTLLPDIISDVIWFDRWSNIEYLITLKDAGDPRLTNFAIVDEQNTALMCACRSGNWRIFTYLWQKDAQGEFVLPPSNLAAVANDLLVQACSGGNLLIIHELLRHKDVDPTADDNAPLLQACKCGHLPVVRELLRKNDAGNYFYEGINPGVKDNLCLISACENGRLEIVKFLLQRKPKAQGIMEYVHVGIDAAAQGNEALRRAVAERHIDVVRFLLQTTEEGNILCPGLAITSEMLQVAHESGDMELFNLLVRPFNMYDSPLTTLA